MGSNGDYHKFLEAKRKHQDECGFTGDFSLNPKLFPFQEVLTRWAIRIGRADIWADCGLGKTAMQLEWARRSVSGSVGGSGLASCFFLGMCQSIYRVAWVAKTFFIISAFFY